MDFEKLILGIDVGTSSVKVTLLDSHTLKSLQTKSVPTKANVSPSHKKGNEQDVVKIVKALKECLTLSESLLKKVIFLFPI